jgi:hypothetical protein
MSVSTPLKFCYHGQHYRPREQFKALPGGTHRREVCADCYAKIMADRKQKRKSGLGRPIQGGKTGPTSPAGRKKTG